jgi:hypothetical protein
MRACGLRLVLVAVFLLGPLDLRLPSAFGNRILCEQCDQWTWYNWEFYWFHCDEPPPESCGVGG